MPIKPQSWKKVREERRKENFVGRADQLKVFADNFTRDVPNHMVFAVTGEGGVGKSTLLLQYETNARSVHDAIVITCDDRHTSPAAAMGHIAGELAKHGFVRKEFDERDKKYREVRQELEGDTKVPRQLVNLVAMGVTDFTIKSLRKVPGAGVFAEYADERAAGEAFAQLINLGIDRWGNKDEVRLLREPEVVLTPLFLDLLGEASARRRVVLMFDVFERTAETLAAWLLALFRFEYGEFNTNLTFVISGRDALEQHWTELAGDLCRVTLEPFTLDETRQYLSNQDITDEPVTAQIHADSGGLPVLVELLAATNPQPGIPLADISQDAVIRFLWWTPQEDRRRVALLAAVPRQFNQDILSAALGEDAAGPYNWLAVQSYIRSSTERGSFYHEKVRELMLRHLRSTTPADLASTHHRLAEFYASAQAQLGLADKAAYDSETWRRLEEARVYHTISEQPDRDVVVAANAFLHAFHWRWRFAENIGQVCRQVGEETDLRSAVDMAATLLAVYGAYDRDDYPVVIEQLGTLDSAASLTPSARRVIFARRGEAYRQMRQYAQALADLDRAIALDEQLDWAIANRGETYRQMGEYAQALADFDRAIALDPDYHWAYEHKGMTLRAEGRYAEAIEAFGLAHFTGPTCSACLAARGATYLLMEQCEQALADFDRAIALDEKYAFAIAVRGETYRQMEQYEQALVDFDRAIALDEKYAFALTRRGETYRQMGQYEQALADLDRAIALDEKYAFALTRRGETHQQMGQYEQALADFDRAIALDEKLAFAIASRGETYRQMGQYEQALADFDRAIALDEKYAFALARRGETHRQMGQYEQALADFDWAIALDEKYAVALARRGETYRQMEQYEQALADFDRAIALDPNFHWAYEQKGLVLRDQQRFSEAIEAFNQAHATGPTCDTCLLARGATYRQMGQYAQALADFNRAIALDEQLDLAIANRGETHRQMEQYEQALADFDRAIALDPNFHWAYEQKGLVLRDQQRFPEAIEAFNKAHATGPTCGTCLSARGATYRQMGQYAQALADFDRAIAIESSNWRLYGRAVVYRLLGQQEAALVDLRTAIEKARAGEAKSPNDWRNRLNLALYYVADGDRTSAGSLYQAAINAKVSETLVRDAVQDLDDYLHLFPDDQMAQIMRTRMQQYINDQRAGSG